MPRIRRLLRAIFVLPFSAGNPKPRHHEEEISHDGSISGLVFLVSVVVILSVILVIASTGQSIDNVHSNLFIITMAATACLAILICIIITFYAKMNPDVVMPSQHWDISGKIMLGFLWFFTLASVFDSVLYLVYHLSCFTHSPEYADIEVPVLFDILLMIFLVIQSGFITYYAKSKFASRLSLYYGLLILFLTNISVVVFHYTYDLRYFHDFTLNMTTNSTLLAWPCDTNEALLDGFEKTESYLKPAIFEYSLLSLLFISEMWPKSINTPEASRQQSYVNESLTERESLLHSNSNVYQNLNAEFRPNISGHRVRKCCSIVIATFISIPGPLLFAIKVYTKGSHKIAIAADGLNSIEISIMVLVTIKCFYQLQTECRPREYTHHFGSKEYLILTSLIGSLAYYTMRIVAYVYLLHLNGDNSDKIFNYVLRILEIYLQTVLIYQMKDYEQNYRQQSSITSMEFSCLFLSVTNLINWAADSFLVSQYVFVNDAPTILYGKRVWTNSYCLLYPFAIFYRFKCFVAFYGLYDRLKL